MTESSKPRKGGRPRASSGSSAASADESDGNDELAAIFARLNATARESLGAAEGIRRSTGAGELHMEHLLAGLYQIDAPAQYAIEAAVITEDEFFAILQSASGERLPAPGDHEIVSLDRLPPITTHVRDALLNASRKAGLDEVRGRDLFYGALQVENCKPVASLLSRQVDAEKAITWRRAAEEATPASRARLEIHAEAQADQPTGTDLIGYQKIVDSLADLLVGTSTTFPLTIAISAPWGGGKSSIMRMVRERLEGSSDAPPWLTVDFPAWRYESGEQLWAAMANATYDKALTRRGWLERQRFRLRVEMRRGSLTRGALRVGGVAAAGVVGAFVGSLAAPAAGVPKEAGATVLGVGGLVAALQAIWNTVADPFKRAVESFAATPGTTNTDGFTSDAATTVDSMMAELLAHGGRVAIFVDDLDRCTPRNLVKVVEAVNQIFVAGAEAIAKADADPKGRRPGSVPRTGTGTGTKDSDGGLPPRLAFIMGMDRQVVARGIEAEYASLKERLDKEGDPAGQDYGLAFLDKIVQLWVTLPPPDDAHLKALLGQVAGMASPSGAAAAKATQDQLRQLEAAAANIDPNDRAGRIAAAKEVKAQIAPEEVLANQAATEAFLAEGPVPTPKNSPLVWEAMQDGLACLERNPRQVKRFNNAFLLQLAVAARSEDVTFSAGQLAALARWVAIRLRWAELARDMDDEPLLLWALEQEGQGATLSKNAADQLAEQRRRTPVWFDSATFPDRSALLRALEVPDDTEPISKLPFKDFVPIA
jgi:hypothetical protein